MSAASLRLHPSARTLGVAAIFLLLGGCATFSSDGGFSSVEAVATDRMAKKAKWVKSGEDADSVQATVKALLAQPLSADDAMQVALLNNRGLQAAYAELGIAEADLVQTGRLRNPGFTFSRIAGGGEKTIDRAWIIDLLGWVTTPIATQIEGRRFEQVKLNVANEMLGVAAATREAYFEAVAAQQSIEYLKQVKISAEAGADLAQRMVRAGNWSRLDQMREQVFYADATAQLAREQRKALAEREKLTRLMGLWGADIEFKLPERLPDLPPAPMEIQDLESFTLTQRLDLQAAKRETEGLAKSLGLTKATRFVNVLDVGYLNVKEPDLPRQTGYQISIEVPIFDWGQARVVKAEAIYMQAVNRYAEMAVNARSEARESYTGYRTAYDLARHYRDEIVPLRKKISDENLLRYNGMLISVFELIADSREQVMAVNGYIDALKEFWLADTGLVRALGGKLPATAVPMTPMMDMKGPAIEMKAPNPAKENPAPASHEQHQMKGQ